MLEVNQDVIAQTRIIEGVQKYQKRPVVVEAYQMNQPFYVQTLEGVMQGKENDFVIVGIRGELYPCDHEIFYDTYLKV
jgi:hypothetical protein